MARLVIELTNRCNLRCQHCFEERHAATGDLSFESLRKFYRKEKTAASIILHLPGENQPFTASLMKSFHGSVRRAIASASLATA